jgi:diguanylate cyclase (GGDEF)-like protein/PAS domain S-box-containing protein
MRPVRKGHEAMASATGSWSREARYRALVAAAPGIVWIANVEAKVVEDLPSWRTFTGQTVDELTNDGWTAALHPDDRSQVTAFVSEATDAACPMETQFRLRRHDGEYRNILLRIVPIFETGKVREWVGIGVDTTEQRHLAEKLAKVEATLERQSRQMTVLDEINAILHACNSLDEAYPQLGRAVVRLLPKASGAFAIGDQTPQMKTVVAWGKKNLLPASFAFDDCWALRRGEPHIVDDPSTATSCAHFTSPPGGPSLCLPLIVHGQTLGLLHLHSSVPLDADERNLAIRLSDIVKVALADLSLRERLRIQAVRDPLTGLFNRQYLDETLPRECQLATRRKCSLSVAMIDIDHFKQLNDNYGHEAGDCVLRELGELMRSDMRSSDIACRYGGEEFVLVMLDADLSATISRLQQMCLDIKRRQYMYQDRTLPTISVSVGVSQFPLHGRSPGEILRAADQALYAAKNAGRDRIVAFAPSSLAKDATPTGPSI